MLLLQLERSMRQGIENARRRRDTPDSTPHGVYSHPWSEEEVSSIGTNE